ncbi:MAG: hypothetical protein ABL984_13570 [Pyrinomonadaceae bacterium]
MEQTSENLRKYLLGSLSASEIEEIDVQIISDTNLSDPLAFAENELIEDYLDGALTPEEEDLFRRNFLTSNERRSMVGETSLLREYADRFSEPLVTVTEPANSVFEKLRSIFARPAFAGATALAALLIALLVWQTFIRDSSTQLEREYAAMNLRDIPAENSFSSISLISSNLRDSNSAPRHSVNNLTDTVLVRLALPAGDDAATFKAVISRGSTKVFAVASVKSYQNPNGREVKMLLPRSILEKGQYQIRLERPSGSGPLVFSLNIE